MMHALCRAACAALSLSAVVASAEVIRVAVIDPASGPFAAPSLNWTKSMQLAGELVGRDKLAGENQLEFTQFDNKGSTQESIVLLRSAIEQGYRYVVNGGSSSVYAALVDAINKHNERNPGKEVMIMTHSVADPEITNGKCSFWSFRFVPNADMYAEAMTSEIAKDESIKKVYIVGQNYPLGQSISKATREYLKRKRPDVEIVGDDLHPMGQVKDFSPYVAKIRASGADVVTTANWGQDLTLLIKAANDAQLRTRFYTYYAHSFGVPSTLGKAAEGRVKNLNVYSPNNQGFVGREMVEGMNKKYNEDFIISSTYTLVRGLAEGIRKANSSDPVKVAAALEGARFADLSGESEMRKSDHQLQTTMLMTSWVPLNKEDIRYGQENTGYGWKIDRKIEPYVASRPTTCQMVRPGSR